MRSLRSTTGILTSAFVLMWTAPIAGTNEVPFKASLSGSSVFTFISQTEVSEDFSGAGQATHLGRFTAEQQHTINLDTLEILGGTFTFTAANGDSVSGSYSGQSTVLPSGLIRFEGVFTFEGGTGRFAAAIGGGDMSGLIDASNFPGAATADLRLDGTISRPGRH